MAVNQTHTLVETLSFFLERVVAPLLALRDLAVTLKAPDLGRGLLIWSVLVDVFRAFDSVLDV